MNCRNVRKQLVELLDIAPDPATQAEVLAHLQTCPQCSKEFEQLKRTMGAVQPAQRVGASPRFEETVMSRIIEMNKGRNVGASRAAARSWKPILAASVAVALIMAVSFGGWLIRTRGTQPLSAFSVLGQAAYAMEGLYTVHISAEMRTSPHGNFESIDLNADLVPLELWKRFSDPLQWRAELPERVAVMDGESSLLWIEPANMAARGPAASGFIGWLATLMDVDQVLESEQRLADEEGSVLTLEHATGPDGAPELVVSVEAVAQGDFTNDWLLNKTIASSDNLRVYRLDAETLFLKGLEVYVHTDEGDVLAFTTTGIEYNAILEPSLFALDLPDDVSWYGEPTADVADEASADGASDDDLTPEETARAFFEACSKADWDEVAKYFPISPLPPGMEEGIRGVEIISIGKAFKSGQYPGWFVPYEIRLRNGEVKKFNLAVRNDNPAGRYIVDGGI